MAIAEKLTTIAENQQKVYDAGYEKGKAEGGGGSYEEGYEQGKIDGNTLLYAKSLANAFRDAEFPSGYEITITAPQFGGRAQQCFSGTKGLRKITMNTPLDVSYIMYNFIYYATDIEELVFPDGIHIVDWNYFATNVNTLKSVIGRLDPSGMASNSICFVGCTALEDISFMPGTIEGAISFNKSSKLSAESVQSIIDGLADLTGKTTQTLTLHATVGGNLTDAQKASITAKNWTLAY